MVKTEDVKVTKEDIEKISKKFGLEGSSTDMFIGFVLGRATAHAKTEEEVAGIKELVEHTVLRSLQFKEEEESYERSLYDVWLEDQGY